MLKTVITLLLIFCLQIIVSAGTDEYVEKQHKLYETSIADAEKEWKVAKNAKIKEEIFALRKYIKAIEGVKAYWTKKEDFDKAMAYKTQADDFRVLLDEMKSNADIPVDKPTSGTEEEVVSHTPKERIPRTKRKPSAKVINLKDVRVTMSSSKEAPAINGEDIANYGTMDFEEKWWYGNHPEEDKSREQWGKGQTFTTKRSDVYLKGITYQCEDKGCAGTKTYTVRVCKVSGNKVEAVIYKGTAKQDFKWNANEYMTWSFNKGIPLSGNTSYSVDIQMTESTTDWRKGGIPFLNCTANEYADGKQYNYCPGDAELHFDEKKDRDRVFHLDLNR
jgi:hypothetical protein